MRQTGMKARRDDVLAIVRSRIERMRKANIDMTAISERTKDAMSTIVVSDEIKDLAEGITW